MTEYSNFQERRYDRGAVIKMTLVYTPITVVCAILCIIAVLNIAGGENGFYFTLVVFGTLGLLTGSQAILYLRDLLTPPMELQGEVVRKWHKGNLFFFFLPSYYITIDSKVCEGSVERVENNGAYIRLESGATGFCPRKEIDGERRKSAQDMVKPGERVNYKVTGLARHGNYKVSCKKAEERSVVGKIFVISRVEYAMLLELDLVKVSCYPHSATVERLERYDESEKRFIPATSGATF